MKILRAVPSMDPKAGGVAEAAKQSAILLSSSGIEIEVVCFDNQDAVWLKEFDFPVYAIGKGVSAYALHAIYLKWLKKHVKNYDLVVIDGLWQFHVVGGYICKLMHIPYVVYTHGMLDPYFNLNRLKYFKKLPFWFLVERNILSMAEAVVFTCEEEKNLAQNSFPFFRGKNAIATLGIEPNPKDPEVLSKKFCQAFPHLEGKRFGLFLSRIHVKKGLELLIDAVAQKREIIPESFVFVIAGTGDQGYIGKLKERISKLEIDQYFEWVGMLTGDMKWGAFAASDFFILPSHQENFGIVVAEALSQSRPVLITNKVNIWREIIQFDAGLVGNDDIADIGKMLKDYFGRTDDELTAMSKNAFECFHEKFSTKAFRQDFLKLLKSLERK